MAARVRVISCWAVTFIIMFSIFILKYLLIFSSIWDFNVSMTLSPFRCGSGRASIPGSQKAPDGRKWRRPRRWLSYRLAQVTCCGLCCGTETCWSVLASAWTVQLVCRPPASYSLNNCFFSFFEVISSFTISLYCLNLWWFNCNSDSGYFPSCSRHIVGRGGVSGNWSGSAPRGGRRWRGLGGHER